jgi:hypothetical protein
MLLFGVAALVEIGRRAGFVSGLAGGAFTVEPRSSRRLQLREPLHERRCRGLW